MVFAKTMGADGETCLLFEFTPGDLPGFYRTDSTTAGQLVDETVAGRAGRAELPYQYDLTVQNLRATTVRQHGAHIGPADHHFRLFHPFLGGDVNPHAQSPVEEPVPVGSGSHRPFLRGEPKLVARFLQGRQPMLELPSG